MRFISLFLLWVAVSAAAITPAEYRLRRDSLRKSLKDGIVILLAASEKPDARGAFFQESNFFYLSGWGYPGSALLLTPDGGDTLFLPAHNPAAEKWTGPQPAPSDPGIAQTTGFLRVLAMESFEHEFQNAIQTAPRIYTLSPDRIRPLAPLRQILDVAPSIAALRMVKSPAELEVMQRSIDVSIEGHRAAWRKLSPGLFEYQLAAVLTGFEMNAGCGRSAYSPIVGSGPNSVALHYARNSRRMDGGEVVVMDAAAECDGYAADITRTVPVSGTFSPRQREIYGIVLGAQQAVIAAVKPGMDLTVKQGPASLYRIAYDYIDSHGKDREGRSLGRYFTHGIGHHVGLNVHDANVPGTPLSENMVVTVEPGIYIPEENLGVRIEDMVLVTSSGAKVLSSALPKEAAAVESAISGRGSRK